MNRIKIPDSRRHADKIIRAVGTNLAATRPARLGNPTDNSVEVEGADRDGLVWVHGLGANPQGAEPALNDAIAPKNLIYGAPVRVKQDVNGLIIVSRDMEFWDRFFAGVSHHDQNPVYISQIMYGTLQPDTPTKSMKALVIGAVYTQADTSYYVADQLTGDFSSGVLDTESNSITVPTTNTRAIGILVQLDVTTGTLSYKQGSEFDANLSHATAFTAGLYPDRDAERFRCGYIRLVKGMTAIGFEHLWVAPELYTAGGGSSGGATTITATAGENLAQRDFVYLNTSDNEWYKVDTDATPPLIGALRGVVSESGGITNNNTGEVTIVGEVTGFSSLTPWDWLYASTTAGGYTQTKPNPSAGGGQVVSTIIGMATSATTVLVKQSETRFLKRESLADAGTTTIQHYADALARERVVRAYLSATVVGATLASYPESNYDADVDLEHMTPATYGSDQCSGGTPSASSEYSGSYPASNAFDDSNSTWWCSSVGTTGWIQYDLGSGVTKTAIRTTIRCPVTYTQYAPKDFTIKGSNNGSDWDTLKTVTGETGWSSNEQRTFDFTNATAYRYYRVDITAVDGGNYMGIAEIEMIEAATWNENEKLAQSFEVTGSQTVGSVSLYLKKVGSPTGNLTVTIETDNSGEPSGTPVANGTSDTVAASTLATSYDLIEFEFSTPPSLSGSTTYWIVLDTADSGSQTNYVVWGADTSSPTYADGEMLSYDASWSAESADACFYVYGEATIFEGGLSERRWTSTSTEFDFAVRYDDGSDGDPDTKTTIKNVSGSTLDMTVEVRLP